VINCAVKRVEGPDLIVEVGKAEARLPRREQSRLEQFSVGDRVRAVILRVERSVKGPQVIISRAAPELVLRLFEQEVPEIYDGTVSMRACAREAGERTKIAVQSRDRDVDSVGACVGMKGMRVESIRRELRGEKIDIVEYSEDPVLFATHALSPAKISRVGILDAAEKHLEVIVDDTQLSLAIGKKGQNVRLASKLIGWRIDIKSEEEKRQEVEWQMGQLVGSGTPLAQLAALSEKLREKLSQHDISSIERLGEMTPEQLEEIPGIGPKMVEKIRAAVQNYWEGTGGETAGEAEQVPAEGLESPPTGEADQDSAAAGGPAGQDLSQELGEDLQAEGESDRSEPGEAGLNQAGSDEEPAAGDEGGSAGARGPQQTAAAVDEARVDEVPGESAEAQDSDHIVRSGLIEEPVPPAELNEPEGRRKE
jgi:N utilization substance protein A